MAELDKVKKGLECLARKQEPMANPCSKCDYHDRPNFAFCVVDVATDALELLKEQDEKEGHWIVLEFCANEGIYCSKCMNKIFDRSTKPKKKLSNYCPNCGSKNTHFFNPSTEKIMYSD